MTTLETLTLLDWCKVFLVWYLIGIVTIIASAIIKEGELRVRDIDESIKMGLFGPMLYVGYFLGFLFRTCEKIQDLLTNHKDKVLWRSKKKRTEHILYGDKHD